jgi:hypothetical protein
MFEDEHISSLLPGEETAGVANAKCKVRARAVRVWRSCIFLITPAVGRQIVYER